MISDGRAWYFILLIAAAATLLICINLLRSRTGRAWRAIRTHETLPRRSAWNCRATSSSPSSQLGDHAVAGALFAYYRGFVSVEAFSLFLAIQYVAMVIVGGMGSLLGRAPWGGFRHAFSLFIESALLALPSAQRFARPAVRSELRRVRAGDDFVPPLRAARPRRHLASRTELFPALALQASRRPGNAGMTLLDVRKLEVVYQRSITAVQGVTLAVQPAQIVALIGTNGAGKTTTLRAISGFLGLDDARVTQGSIIFKGDHIENRPPYENTARGIVLVPERDKVFPNLTVAENLTAPIPRGTTAAQQRQREALVFALFPQLRDLRSGLAAFSPAASGRCWRLASAIVCAPQLLLVDELSLGWRRSWSMICCCGSSRFAASSGSPSCSSSRAPRSLWRSRTTATSWRTENRARWDRTAAARSSRRRGVLSRRQERRTPQLSRREAISPPQAMVWLRSRSTASRCGSAGLTVLDQVSFAVEKGELFALIGPNGAGKTSVLNCVSGIYRGAGDIRLRGMK